MTEMRISFCAIGHVNQRVKIHHPDWQDLDKVKAGLRDGTLATSVQDGGSIIIVNAMSGYDTIGTVDDSDNNMEYTDFEVELV